ncbi:ABC transporter, ATP-binding protein [hydrothermal vent metagenome]|uniref:ABC transporter, ATP-binding protein n=1 Tax=hydrothermal vent metagenome TaxID=652676 RepID=A0A3B1B8S4_9ZZZZ
MINLHNIDAQYKDHDVLKGISLRIERGERVALVGPSGSGKTTLLKLCQQQCGSNAALVPQDLGLVKPLSVFHNIYMGRLKHHSAWYNLTNLVRPRQRDVTAVSKIAERLGLEEKLFQPVAELSGGQQQRTAVGRALYQQGQILIGDEPVSSVDEHRALGVLAAINEACDTVLLAMHDLDLALAFTDRVIALRDGRIALDETTSGMTSADLAGLYKH